MSWIQKLYDSYDACKANAVGSEARVWPISHFVKRAHVEVVLDGNGVFRRARKLERSEAPTLIPATEASAGRTSGMAAHPLCEELSYCASDLPNREERRFSEYSQKLRQWCTSPQAHPKAQAVLAYATTGTLWADLNQGQLLPMCVEDVRGNKTKVADDKVFVRWRVEVAGDPCSGTWEDRELIDRWTLFDKNTNARSGFCMVTGTQQRLSQNHPRFIRSSGDGGKLISANDFDGYTFRGKFTDGKLDYEKQTCSVGFEVSQKAHNALRWLIARQGSRNGDQVIVCWAVSGKPVPDPLAGTYELLGIEHNPESAIAEGANAGQAFALRLNKAIAGYKANLDPTEEVVVMGLDSATPGRLAITYYRELRGSELLARIESWHLKCAWPQNFGKNAKFIGAPSPRDIAQAAYGRRLDERLDKAARERLLPCIVDGAPVPHDLVASVARRAINRIALEPWEWEKFLGIACALLKGKYIERNYQMTLEMDRTSRDYLYGRLLAVAEHIESRALYLAGEAKRETTAARLMQRFADRPHSTWRTIELSLVPYMVRLRNLRPDFLHVMKRELDDVTCAFEPNDFTRDGALSGEFLLGYHCQRQKLRPAERASEDVASADDQN